MTLGSHTLGWAFIFLLCFTLINRTWGDCGLPDRILNAEPKTGALDQQTFSPNATVSYDCRPGFIRIPGSKNSITCLENGIWSTPEVFCQRKPCGNPGEVENGNMEATDFLFGSIVHYTCNEGFRSANRRNFRECLADGTWSNVAPQCEAIICPAPESPANGQYNPQKEEYTYLDSVTFSCQKPFEVAGNATISCTGTGEWSSTSPTCKDVNCPNPDVKNSKRLSGFTGPYTLNSAISFECNNGFFLRGSSSISCNIDSQWVPAIPECKILAVNCPDPDVKNSERLSGLKGPYTLNSVISFKCDRGFLLKGSSSITCNIDSQWVPPIPQCESSEKPSCGDHGTIPNGKVSTPAPDFHVGSKAFYTCNEGYMMSTTQDFKECQEDGMWSSIACIEKHHSPWKIIGIVLGTVVLIVVVVAAGILIYKYISKRQRGKKQPETPVQYSHVNA